MSASLVGSEMCIRDSSRSFYLPSRKADVIDAQPQSAVGAQRRAARGLSGTLRRWQLRRLAPVSWLRPCTRALLGSCM
eukprot:11921366-Alexandrium_andersonii.AAC.1